MKREQLTITLRDDLIRRVDAQVDGIKVRNRSHAIEVLLSKALSRKSVTKAVVLAGGKGTRMRPFTYEMPKPMIPVKGKPLLQHILELLRKHDVRDITLATGYLGEKIAEHFGNGGKFGVDITYVQERKPLGTAGCLNLIKDDLNESFFMLNGDILSSIDLTDLAAFHAERNAAATIALTAVEEPSRFGVANLKGDNILEFTEKPAKGKEPSKLINAGIYLLEPEVLDVIPEGKSMMETDVFPRLAREGRLFGYSFTSQWFDTGTLESYENVIKNWRGVK